MNVKKIAAKEGLIILAVEIVGLTIFFAGRHLNTVYVLRHPEAQIAVVHGMQYSLTGYIPYVRMMSAGLKVAVFGYPVLAVGRFVIWAVKTLRTK